MKNLLLLFILITSATQAQYKIKGTMTPPEKNSWAILQKLQGTKPKFISNTDLKNEDLSIGGNKQTVTRFEFTLPKNASKGMYRVTYNERSGFIDFLFNGENVEMIFNPKYPDHTVKFVKSLENKVYREYLDALALTQGTVDSIQISYLKTDDRKSKKAYKKALEQLEDTQKLYEGKSDGMLANHFIKASKTTNSSYALDDTQDYLDGVTSNFFNNIDFSSKELYNSSFLVNKIVDYVFYLNSAENQQLQQQMYKESIPEILSKISDNSFKKQVIEFLITDFTGKRNSEIVDWLFDNHYNELPSNLQDANFKKNKLEALQVSVGRTAPDFSWKEDGKDLKLSTLNDGERYLLIFWSTKCPHCTKEVPEVHEMMKKHKGTSVIAFAIESNGEDMDFNSWSKNKLYNFHNVMGTHPEDRFKNKTVQDYLIAETPTYFILDKNKKIIAVPNTVKDVEDFLNSSENDESEEEDDE